MACSTRLPARSSSFRPAATRAAAGVHADRRHLVAVPEGFQQVHGLEEDGGVPVDQSPGPPLPGPHHPVLRGTLEHAGEGDRHLLHQPSSPHSKAKRARSPPIVTRAADAWSPAAPCHTARRSSRPVASPVLRLGQEGPAEDEPVEPVLHASGPDDGVAGVEELVRPPEVAAVGGHPTRHPVGPDLPDGGRPLLREGEPGVDLGQQVVPAPHVPVGQTRRGSGRWARPTRHPRTRPGSGRDRTRRWRRQCGRATGGRSPGTGGGASGARRRRGWRRRGARPGWRAPRPGRCRRGSPPRRPGRRGRGWRRRPPPPPARSRRRPPPPPPPAAPRRGRGRRAGTPRSPPASTRSAAQRPQQRDQELLVGDGVGGPAEEQEGAADGRAQADLGLDRHRPGEHRLGGGLGLLDPPAPGQRVDELGHEQVVLRVGRAAELEGPSQQGQGAGRVVRGDLRPPAVRRTATASSEPWGAPSASCSATRTVGAPAACSAAAISLVEVGADALGQRRGHRLPHAGRGGTRGRRRRRPRGGRRRGPGRAGAARSPDGRSRRRGRAKVKRLPRRAAMVARARTSSSRRGHPAAHGVGEGRREAEVVELDARPPRRGRPARPGGRRGAASPGPRPPAGGCRCSGRGTIAGACRGARRRGSTARAVTPSEESGARSTLVAAARSCRPRPGRPGGRPARRAAGHGAQGDDDEEGQVGGVPGQRRQRGQRGAVGPVEVVEEEGHGAGHAQLLELDDGLVDRHGPGPGAGLQGHDRALGVGHQQPSGRPRRPLAPSGSLAKASSSGANGRVAPSSSPLPEQHQRPRLPAGRRHRPPGRRTSRCRPHPRRRAAGRGPGGRHPARRRPPPARPPDRCSTAPTSAKAARADL